MPQQATLAIRPATPSDALSIATIHIASWRAAYVNIVPQSHLDNLSLDDRVNLWQRILSTPGTAGGILVAEEDDGEERRVVGFVSFGPVAVSQASPQPSSLNNKDKKGSDEQERTAELRAIYISPSHWTKGIGQALWKTAYQQLIREGFTHVVVKVFAGNQRARRFYAAVGFRGEEKGSIEIGGVELETVSMRMGL